MEDNKRGAERVLIQNITEKTKEQEVAEVKSVLNKQLLIKFALRHPSVHFGSR